MAGLLGNLLDRDNPAKKIQKEIESTEFKKQSLITPLQNEINAARNKIDHAFYQIGKKVFEWYGNNEEIGDRLTAYFEEILSQNIFIEEKEAKIKEFSARYDEELAILRSNIGVPPQTAPQSQPYMAPASGAGAFCGNCGKPYLPGEDMFCVNCGQKLG